jgi:hypothetical protein
MALITQFAQPGMYVARGMAEARENRLAMAAEEAERATERAQQEAIRNILGVSGQASSGMGAPAADPALAAAEAAGVPGVGLGLAPAAGGRAVGVQPPAQQPSQPQAPRLPYSELQIQAMTMVDRQVASEMRQQNAAAASVIERQTAANERAERLFLSDADLAAQRIANSPNPDEQRPATIRAFSEQHNIPIAQAEEIIRRREQISAAPRDTEIERLMRGAGIDPQSEDGQAIYRDLLRRRREGSGISEMARSIANLSRAIAAGATPEGAGARDRAVQGVSDAIESVGTTLRTAQTIAQGNPGAFGQRGNIARDTGAVVEQLFGSGAANVVAQFVSGGAGLDELARIRAATQIQVAQSIPDFTGEESGRITEAERAITEQAVGATNALSSQSGAMEALAYVYPLQLSRVNRQRLLSRGRLEYAFIKPNGEVDLDVLDQHLGAPMRQAGFTDEQIQRAGLDIVAITRQQAALLASGAFANE